MAPPPPLLQFLNSVLSQRGPNSLPYPEDVKWLIRQHLVALIETYPSLQPKTATFTHNDGTTVNLLQADGTIPMVYQNVTYNIPIIVWLMESYPRQPPCVYVAPTRDMIIKRPHPFVNPSGLVAIGYLQHWVYPSSNLVDMVRELGVLFGRDPPLYTRQQAQSPRPNPPEPRPSPNPTPTPAIPPRVYSNLGSPYGSGGGSGRFPPSPQRQSHSHSHSHSNSQSPMTDDPNEVFKRNAINKLTESLATDIAALGKARAAEMEGLLSLQHMLRQREEEISKGMREMNEEKEGLEQQLQMVLMNEDILEAWLRDNEGKVAGRKANVDAEEVFETMDPLSKQMLECTSSDLAIEDVIYELDKAVQRGCIPFDQYLKQIRSLSREQFFHRATAAKVRAARMRY